MRLHAVLVAIALLAPGARPSAENILRRAGNAAVPSADLSAVRAAQAAQAAALARQAQNPLRQAFEAIKTSQAAQRAAREAAQADTTDVPDGLVRGGLWPAQGYAVPELRLWQGAGPPVQSIQDGNPEVTVTQTAPRAILTWETFNVGPRTDLHFDQSRGGDSAASWVALNRVVDPSASPSRILGSIRAEGQVYVLNRNGILFGGTSQVNVGSLVVSGLDIAPTSTAMPDQRFLNDTLYTLSFAAPSASSAGGTVTVDPGAQISAASGGRVMLLGGQVVNGGSIQAPDGQVILAAAGAGNGIQLAASSDLAAVRGLGVPTIVDPAGAPVVKPDGGAVANTGIVSTDRGNITMVAGQTLQDGLLTATTGAEANGSIELGADGFVTSLGGSSVTQILPDTGGRKVIGSGDSFKRSTVELRGDRITLLDGARIYAPSGSVSLSAVMTDPGGRQTDPLLYGTPPGDDTRLYVGSGARIDVSGLTDVEVPMEQNSIRAELRANELADDPLLRDNPELRSRTIWFDGRRGVDPGVANVSGYYDLVERDVSQLMTSGGSVTLAANKIITREGSVIDLSGGSLRYLDGYVKRSVLIDPNGYRVPIESAKPGVSYVGLDGDFVVNHARWGITETYSSSFTGAATRFERGYEQGGSAGTLTLSTNQPAWFRTLTSGWASPLPVPADPSATAAVRILDGDVVAMTIAGPYQRQLPDSSAASSETWQLQWQRDWLRQPQRAALQITGAGDVKIGDIGTQLPSTFDPDSSVDASLYFRNDLPVAWFNGRTFQVVSIQSGYDPDVLRVGGVTASAGTIDRAPGGHLSIGTGVRVDLGDGGAFSFTGKSAVIDGEIVAPGGTVSLTALQQGADPAPSATLHLGATGAIDVAGRFTNDATAGLAGPLRALDGGKVSLTAASVVLDPGSLVDASGGARLDVTGTKLSAGKGGAIAIDVSRYPMPGGDPGAQTSAFEGSLVLGGALRGYALKTGGSLTLRTGFDVVIGDDLGDAASPYARLFKPEFFTHGGFSSYSILGERSVTVTRGTELLPSQENLALPNAATIPTGMRLDDVGQRRVLPGDWRGPMTLSLSTVPSRSRPSNPGAFWDGETQDLYVEAGAEIRLDPGSTVNLASTNVLRIDGAIETPGGNITLTVNDVPTPPAGSRIAAGTGIDGPGVYLTQGSALRAGGYTKSTPVANNQMRRSVEPGGQITISSTGNVKIDREATIDVAGIQGIADLTPAAATPADSSRYDARIIDGNAGSVSITAAAGVVAGDLRLAPGGPNGVGGSLAIQQLELRAGALVLSQGSPSAAGTQDLAVVADDVNASGADDLTLRAVVPSENLFSTWGHHGVLFDGDVDLHTRRSLTLVAPSLQPTLGRASSVTLASGYVALEGVPTGNLPFVDGANQNGDLMVRADLIDVARTVLLGCASDGGACTAGGFATTRLIAKGDIRLSDRDAAGIAASNPGLLSPGSLELDSAQVYVTSRKEGEVPLDRPADDPGFLVAAGGQIALRGNGNATTFPLSYGERLTLEAPVIVQGGVLRAPQGQIRLVATGVDGSVTLESGSLTSASLEGHTVPFGTVQTGGVFVGYDEPGEAPTKSVDLKGANVAVNARAVIDVSGGGDLQGFAFVAGNGGSKDVLDSSKGFAVLPNLGTGNAPAVGSAPAPVSPDGFASDGSGSLRDARLQVGDQIWLHGVPGLPDGYYTLLPAHYALLPGGLLVEPLGGSYSSPPATYTRLDGAVVAAGCVTSAGSCNTSNGAQAVFEQYVVLPQQVFGRYSQLETYSFDQYASALAQQNGAAVRTPADAGTAVLDAGQSLVLQGTGRLGAANGLLGNLDISAPNIAVVGAGATAPAGYLALDPQAIENFGAGSVLLGGTRSAMSSGTALTVNAANVLVDTGTGAPWAEPEIILAGGTVTVADGTAIRAAGSASVDSSMLLVSRNGGGGDAALLRLSTGSRVEIQHLGATGQAGDLDIGSKASLTASGSLTLDGSRSIKLSPDALLSGRQVDLASTRVNLGDATPAGATGATLGTTTLEALGSSADVLIRGQQEIDVYGDVSLGTRNAGTPTLQKLTFDTALLQGQGGTTRITAGDLTLQNGGAAVPNAAAGGTGSLLLDVDTLHLGPGTLRIAGYAAVSGTAGTLEARGKGELDFAGDLALQTNQLQAASGASSIIDIGGAVSLTRPAGGAAPPAPTALGGRMTIDGSTVVVDTSVALPAGSFEAKATAGDLTVGPTASIDVRGASADFQGQLSHAPGGTIRLSASGNLDVRAGATLDVSGDAKGGDAGTIELTAGSAAGVEGTLRGSAASGFQGGSFALDAGTLASASPFSALEASLGSGGFDAAMSLRLRAADIAVAAGDRIRAHDVELTADTGRVTVAGSIDASGSAAQPDGGRIRIVGGDGVSVTGALDAHAGTAPEGGFDPASGQVEIVATAGSVDVAPASPDATAPRIDVSGGRDGGGTVVVRAPRQGNDVAVYRLNADIQGAREIVVQGSESYVAGAVDSALVQTMLGDATQWLQASRSAITQRLQAGNRGLGNLQVAPAAVVTSAGDLTIKADVPIGGAFGPGHLGFEAQGNIVVENGVAVSDGFDSSNNLLSTPSASLSFEAGRDITLGSGAMVRTGTGAISMLAGHDLVLQDRASSSGAPAVIYTAGMHADPAVGFTGGPAGTEFPVNGGDIDIRAGHDILSPLATQTTSAWLLRQGATNWIADATQSTVSQQTSWSIDFQNFEQGVGALGGGDVRVRAGNDITDLQVSIPTTGQLTTPEGSIPQPGDLVVRGGGDLRLSAGGDIWGGEFMLGRGHAELRAGGGLLPTGAVPLRKTPAGNEQEQRSVGALFGLMDATATVTAGSSIDIEGAFDPARQAQLDANGSMGTAFRGYTDRTALAATSLGGSVTYESDPWASVDMTLVGSSPKYPVTMRGSGSDSLNDMFSRAPPTLRLTSLQSSVTVDDRFDGIGTLTLASAPLGTLELVAKEDVHLQIGAIAMDDVDPKYGRGPLVPFTTTSGTADRDPGAASDAETNSRRGFEPIHAGDPDPVRIYALDGSVCAQRSGACTPDGTASTHVVVPKPMEVIAGRDIVEGNFELQNDGPNDVSLFVAGRDIYEPNLRIRGEGAAVIQAGRDIVLNQYANVTTTGGYVYSLGNRVDLEGKLVNQALPSGKGADLYVLAGAANGVDWDAFAAAYLDPANDHGVVRTYLPELAAYMKGLGVGPLSDADLVAAFQALPLVRREVFLYQVYFTELKQTGIEHNDPSSPRYQSYRRGFDAVSLLFPTDPSTVSPAQRGDVILNGKPLETQADASIAILAPYGSVRVGTQIPAPGADPAQGGVVTRRGGNISIMSDRDIDLFTSRVFTLQGGDILMWTSDGSITAGSGSKTSVFQAPLDYKIDPAATISIDAFGLQTGAGIGVLDALENAQGRTRSRLDLIAPNGEVNAGDAGIRATGDLNIAAAVVVGIENIQVSGASAGVPKVEAPNVGALTTASQVAQAASQQGVGPEPAAVRNAAADLPSIITVEVVGYETTEQGEEPADKRKKKDAPPNR